MNNGIGGMNMMMNNGMNGMMMGNQPQMGFGNVANSKPAMNSLDMNMSSMSAYTNSGKKKGFESTHK